MALVRTNDIIGAAVVKASIDWTTGQRSGKPNYGNCSKVPKSLNEARGEWLYHYPSLFPTSTCELPYPNVHIIIIIARNIEISKWYIYTHLLLHNILENMNVLLRVYVPLTNSCLHAYNKHQRDQPADKEWSGGRYEIKVILNIDNEQHWRASTG